MAQQRIWRDSYDAPPPGHWHFIYLPFERPHDDPDWYTHLFHFIRDEGVGSWAHRVRMDKSTFSDKHGALYAFSDLNTAMAVKLRWG